MTGLRRVLEKAEADNKAVREKISQMPWGSKELANDPAQLIRKTWGPADDPTKLKRSRQLRQALREQGDPDGLITDYRKLIAHDMMSNVTDKNTGMVDPFKLDQYLNRHQELLTEWYTSPKDRKSGLDLVDGMKSYAEIGKSLLGNARLTRRPGSSDAHGQQSGTCLRGCVHHPWSYPDGSEAVGWGCEYQQGGGLHPESEEVRKERGFLRCTEQP